MSQGQRSHCEKIFNVLKEKNSDSLNATACSAALALLGPSREPPTGENWTRVKKPPACATFISNERLSEALRNGRTVWHSKQEPTVRLTKTQWRRLGTDGLQWKRLPNDQRPDNGYELPKALPLIEFLDAPQTRQMLNDRPEDDRIVGVRTNIVKEIRGLDVDSYVRIARHDDENQTAAIFVPVANGLHGVSEHNCIKINKKKGGGKSRSAGGSSSRQADDEGDEAEGEEKQGVHPYDTYMPATEAIELMAHVGSKETLNLTSFCDVVKLKLKQIAKVEVDANSKPAKQSSKLPDADIRLSDAVKRLQTFQNAFEALDTSGDGKLDKKELIEALEMFGQAPPSDEREKAKFDELFEQIDVDDVRSYLQRRTSLVLLHQLSFSPSLS